MCWTGYLHRHNCSWRCKYPTVVDVIDSDSMTPFVYGFPNETQIKSYRGMLQVISNHVGMRFGHSK